MTREFLGTGWEHPVTTDRAGRIRVASAETDIEQAISLILATAPGERVMRPDFGCAIHDFPFETMDTVTLDRVAASVREALVEWEPRIEVVDVTVETVPAAEGRLDVDIDYRVRSSNTQFNFVFPFYLTEA